MANYELDEPRSILTPFVYRFCYDNNVTDISSPSKVIEQRYIYDGMGRSRSSSESSSYHIDKRWSVNY